MDSPMFVAADWAAAIFIVAATFAVCAVVLGGLVAGALMLMADIRRQWSQS